LQAGLVEPHLIEYTLAAPLKTLLAQPYPDSTDDG